METNYQNNRNQYPDSQSVPEPEKNDNGIFNGQFSDKNEQSSFDPAAWAEQKREQRQRLYDTVEEMSEKALSDPATLAAYLKVQARLGKTSVSNALLVTAQKPDASFISGFDDWQKRGRSVKKGEKGLAILEANGEYARADGTMGVNFDVKTVFDVAQTYGKPMREHTAPTIKSAIKAITKDSPVPVRMADDVPERVIALYNDGDKSIHVARDANGGELFFALSRELARAQTGQDTFLCDCAANVACLRYGVSPKLPDRIPDELASLESREKRSALNIVREAAVEITGRIDHNLFAERQQARNEPER